MVAAVYRLLVAALVLALLAGHGEGSKPRTGSDKEGQVGKASGARDEERLQGTWAIVSFEKDGRKQKDVSRGRVLIKGKDLSLGEEGQVGETFTVRLHPELRPKGIDLRTAAEPKAPTLGIYKLEGDSLTLCLRGRGARNKDGTPAESRERARPGKFSSEDGNVLLVLTRKKS